MATEMTSSQALELARHQGARGPGAGVAGVEVIASGFGDKFRLARGPAAPSGVTQLRKLEGWRTKAAFLVGRLEGLPIR